MRREFGYQEPMNEDAKNEAAPGADAVAARGDSDAAGRAVTEADRRRERAAAKLRENLGRRKLQVRARRAGQADEADGLPAAKMDES